MAEARINGRPALAKAGVGGWFGAAEAGVDRPARGHGAAADYGWLPWVVALDGRDPREMRLSHNVRYLASMVTPVMRN